MDSAQLFIDIVKIDSPSGYEKAMGEYVISFLSRLNIESTVDSDGNIYATIPGTGKPIVLTAHLDTVEPGRGIMPSIRDGVIKSDGTTILGADNKAAVAAILGVVEKVCADTTPHIPLELVFSVREETDAGIKSFNFTQVQSKEGYCFDSSGPIGNIVTKAAFITEFEVIVTGKAAHGGIEPENGINALTAASRAIASLEWGRLDNGNLTANIGRIEGGDAINTVPARVVLRGDVRSTDISILTSCLERIDTVFAKEAAVLGASAKCHRYPYCEGYVYGPDNPLVVKGTEALREIGAEPHFIRSNGGADANEFVKNGIAMLNFGYGATAIHTTEEAISVIALETLEKLVYTLIMKG